MQKETLNINALIEELIAFLQKGNAHATFNDAIKDIPFEDLEKKPEQLPYSIWQITEHIRLAQKDIVDFSANKNYKELNWPEDYWPKDPAPKTEAAWVNCIKEINDDLDEFIQLLKS